MTPPQFNIEWVGTPNQRQGRGGQKPIAIVNAIVNHITAGNFPGCLVWMQNPNTPDKGSAHYLITRTGRILQMVLDENTSNHAGAAKKPNWPLYKGTNPNRYTIGIEHEGFDGTLTDIQYQATLWLHRHLIDKWNIVPGYDTIIGHYRIDSVNRPNCPGPKFPWEQLFSDLIQGGAKMAITKKEQEYGENAVTSLAKKGLVNNPEVWSKKMGESVPNWLFFVMLDRITNK